LYNYFPYLKLRTIAPGSGKGSQCVKLAEKYGYLHISTGDLLRNEVKLSTDIGKAAQEAMQKGAMVPMVTFVLEVSASAL
jgi:adenylate kinase family enzyme